MRVGPGRRARAGGPTLIYAGAPPSRTDRSRTARFASWLPGTELRAADGDARASAWLITAFYIGFLSARRSSQLWLRDRSRPAARIASARVGRSATSGSCYGTAGVSPPGACASYVPARRQACRAMSWPALFCGRRSSRFSALLLAVDHGRRRRQRRRGLLRAVGHGHDERPRPRFWPRSSFGVLGPDAGCSAPRSAGGSALRMGGLTFRATHSASPFLWPSSPASASCSWSWPALYDAAGDRVRHAGSLAGRTLAERSNACVAPFRGTARARSSTQLWPAARRGRPRPST